VADIVADGKTRVAYIPAIANIAAPTTTELNAGTLLHYFITAEGLTGLQPSTNTIPTTSLASTSNTSRNGRVTYEQFNLEIKKQDGTDTIYNLLVRGLAGFLAVRNSIAVDTAWASTQKLRVYPIEVGEAGWVDPEPDSLERYMVPMTVTVDPNQRSAVA
jgi:hypothetical protein